MSTQQAAVNGEIKHANDWLMSNKLTLNCSKTKCMVLTRTHELQKIKINVVAGAIEKVNQVKYLRVLVDNQLKWQQQLDHVCKKLACASCALLKLRAFSPISTLKTVYYALVHPHLSYGLACWSNATKTPLKKIIILQNKIVRLMTYSDQRTPASGLYKSLQILALENMIKLTFITIAHSFHHEKLPKIFDNLFKYLKTSHSYNTRIRSNQNFFKPSVYTNIGKKSI